MTNYKEHPGPQVEGIKYTKPVAGSDQLRWGGGPGKRRRGYYRALKRGEMWALIQQSQQEMLRRMNREMFGFHD